MTRRFNPIAAGAALARYYTAALVVHPELRDLDWYGDAVRRLNSLLLRPASPCEIVALAILSPETNWDRLLVAFAADLNAGEGLARMRRVAYPLNVAKAERALRCFMPDAALALVNRTTSPKVRAFALALLGDATSVTVDRHSAQVVLGRPLRGRREYDDVAAAHHVAASCLGVPARDVQARTWVAWRDRGFRMT